MQAAVDRMLAAPAPSASLEAQQQHLKLLVEVYKRTHLLAEQLQVRMLFQRFNVVTWQYAICVHRVDLGRPPTHAAMKSGVFGGRFRSACTLSHTMIGVLISCIA